MGQDSWRYFPGNGNVWSMLAGDNELGHVYPFPPELSPTTMLESIAQETIYFQNPLLLLTLKQDSASGISKLSITACGITISRRTPILGDITVDGRDIKALAQIRSKASSTFLIGKPVILFGPLKNVPSQNSNMPGEVYRRHNPSQPKPRPFDYQGGHC
ncbi:MAG: hypothetical protein Ct9H300mP25_05940 [Acidobacteriota bacterium]|nr:MAG: hypothetical protein Ct9H300mP25_05940 [Acidobacteriota bacterium]